MNRLLTKGSLSPQHVRLLETMQEINFGRIEQLEIRDGQPVFNPAPRVIRDIKLGGECGPRPELATSDFVLRPVIELFNHFSQIGNGIVESITIKNGLPFKLVVEQPAQASV